MEISVIIPTYNRSNALDKCLEHLHQQNFDPKDFEVIVVDDGSTDNTAKIIQKWDKKIKHLKYLKQKNQGPGVARNQGIAEAGGKISILIGNDIYTAPDFLFEHIKVHDQHPEVNYACLGHIEWYPDQEITPLMEWLCNGSTILGKFGGHQFAFEKLEDQEPDFNFFYTSNISLKTELLKEHKFDPWFSGYGWEDIELGYRLTKKANLKIAYNPQALAYHDHHISNQAFARRMQGIGRNAKLFDKKYPELEKVPTGNKRAAFEILANPLTIKSLFFGQKISKKVQPLYFYALSKKYFLEGLKEC